MKLSFRRAERNDLEFLVDMLSDDKLGAKRENNSLPLDEGYINAFQSIEKDPNNELIVVESEDQVIGMLQLTFIPYLTHIGSWRCLVEGVRIHSNYRGLGLGTDFFKWAISYARNKKCRVMQLTSDKQRTDALRFYESLGFQATHEGFKLVL